MIWKRPEKKIDQIISDTKQGLGRARQELLKTLGTSKRLDKKYQEQLKEAESWEEKAVLALENDDETLAREALRRKQRATKEATQTQTQAAQQATTADQMKETLERIEQKIEDLKAKRHTLAAQVRSARDDKDDTTTTSKTIGGGAFSDLEQMIDHVDQLEAEVEAHEVVHDPGRAQMDAKFRELEKDENDDELDDQLAALKAKLK